MTKLGFWALIALALVYIVMTGGGTYEHLNVTRIVTSAPPKSLYMLQGEFGFNPIKFWAMFRPISLLLFILALIGNWKAPERRKWILGALGVDVLIIAATFLYFAPETGVLLAAPYNSSVDPALVEKAQRWHHLNTIRLMAFYVNGLLLLLAVAVRDER